MVKDAKEIAIEAIREKPESYYVEPFEPHPWVILAINNGIKLGIGLAKMKLRRKKVR